MKHDYSIHNVRVGEPPEPTEEARLRRDIATQMQRIIDRLVRMDAPQEQLNYYAAQLAVLADDMQQWPRRQLGPILQRLLQGTGSQQDMLDVFDHEIMTGLAHPMSPPLTLWLDGNVVRGRANLGLPWQGPPGRVHGGVISLMFDILLAKTQDMLRGFGMTGTLNTRYLAGTPLKTDIDMEAWIERVDGRKLFSRGRFLVDGKPVVEAEGIWICASGDYQWKPEFQPDRDSNSEDAEGVA